MSRPMSLKRLLAQGLLLGDTRSEALVGYVAFR